MLELIELSPSHKDSFLATLDGFQTNGRFLGYTVEDIVADFPAFVRHADNQKDRVKIPPDRVPCTHYWLYEDTITLIGHLSLRHELSETLFKWGGHIGYSIHPAFRRQGYGTTILRLGLPKVRALGLSRVLVTCDETNIGSRKIIEANGGQFENALAVEDESVRKLRYWIELS